MSKVQVFLQDTAVSNQDPFVVSFLKKAVSLRLCSRFAELLFLVVEHIFLRNYASCEDENVLHTPRRTLIIFVPVVLPRSPERIRSACRAVMEWHVVAVTASLHEGGLCTKVLLKKLRLVGRSSSGGEWQTSLHAGGISCLLIGSSKQWLVANFLPFLCRYLRHTLRGNFALNYNGNKPMQLLKNNSFLFCAQKNWSFYFMHKASTEMDDVWYLL